MRPHHADQLLSYALRLPEAAQADALQLLDASREVVNAILTALWPALDVFAEAHPGPAWKRVDALLPSPAPHGSRQWRCEAEVAGRILRAQAARKHVFALVLPLLTADFLRPATQTHKAGKHRSAIAQAVSGLKAGLDEDPASFVELQNVVEQCCNYFLREDRFPRSYEDLQPLPLLQVGLLTYAGDDGGVKGQAHRFHVDLTAGMAQFRFRCPDAQGAWAWRETEMALPPLRRARLAQGEAQAPTLREVHDADGGRYAVLDIPVAVESAPLIAWEQVERVLGVDWGVHTLLTTTALDADGNQVGRPFFLDTGGFDGRQARTRRQIDQLKRRSERLEAELLTLPEASTKAAWMATRLLHLRRELARCWQKYARRNRALAHLASNVLLVLAQVQRCLQLAVESLTTLKTMGRGKSTRSRWRHYRNNTQLRGEIWRLLRYKCRLAGLRFHTVAPRDTSHTCPRCGHSAQTYRTPDQRDEADPWGRWLYCANCGYSADRDYAASVNIARLGVAYLVTQQTSSPGKALSLSHLKPASYTGAGSALRLPPTGPRPARHLRGTICYYPGWLGSAFLQSSQLKSVFPRLCPVHLSA